MMAESTNITKPKNLYFAKNLSIRRIFTKVRIVLKLGGLLWKYLTQKTTFVVHFYFSLMNYIELENIRCYSYHGCLVEESKIGSDYRVDLIVETDLTKSSLSDELADTVDYVHLNAIVKEEMAIRSKLLEHVAKRILDRIGEELPDVKLAKVSVAKLNPPIGGDVASVKIGMQRAYTD